MRKTIVLSLLSIFTLILCISTYYLSLNFVYIKYDASDYDLCSEFEKNLDSEIETLVDQNIDAFVDDLLGFGMAFNALIGNDEEFVEGVWEEHFGKPMAEMVDDRVGILKYQLLENNYALCSELAIEENSDPKTFDKHIREAFLKSFNNEGVSISQEVSNVAIPSNVASISAGVVAGSAVAFVLKKSLISIIIGWIVEESVESAVSEEISNSIKPKILASIKNNLQVALHSENGLYREIHNSVATFHDERNARIGRKLSLEQFHGNVQFFLSSPITAANMYSNVIYEDSIHAQRKLTEMVN